MASPASSPDWEAFYRDYRKPGYVPGFEITTKLGGGMFGLVFRARKQSIGKDYAIKFLQVDDTEVRRAVLAELEQVKWFAQIDHPNLVSIEDRGEVDGIPFLVMSFAGTETLRDRIGKGGVPPSPEVRDELLRWFVQCCRGLSALHERSLVHFDVKPANVFLKGPVARLGDYGLSKLVTHSRGSLTTGRGTPYYMAPEMLQRRGDHRSDIYSAGVMLYELLCSRVPFTGDSEWEVLRQHETKAPDLPPHLSPVERSVLQRCLQKDPAARFQSVQDLIAALGATPSAAPASAAPLREPAVDDLPPCVPPPLPAALPPAVEPRRRSPSRARPAGAGSPSPTRAGTTLLAMFVVASMIAWSALGSSRQGRLVAASPSPRAGSSRTVRSEPTTLAGRVDQLVAQVLQSLRSSPRRAPDLRPLDPLRVELPLDLASWEDRVGAMADLPFAPGLVRRIEQWGRPAFLAGVALLQDLDYGSMIDCQRAAHLQKLLTGVTDVDALCADPVTDAPSAGETARMRFFADGWRRLAEQFAANDEQYRRLLAAKGSGAGVDR